MNDIRRILVPTDFSDNSRRALRHAAMLAKREEAEILLLHVRALFRDDPYHPEFHFPDQDEIDRILGQVYTDEMAGLKEEVAGRTEAVEIRDVAVAPAILNFAEKREVDLIVMGTHGRTGVSHALLGSIAERVARGAKVPVLTVPLVKDREVPETYRKIVVPLDFSPASRNALLEAVRVARASQGKLFLLHVIEEVPHPAFYFSGKSDLREAFPGIEKRARREAEELIAACGGGDVPYDVLVAEGKVFRQVAKLAGEIGADLVVIGSPERTGIDRFLLGSVTEKVLRTAPCPVLAVRGAGAEKDEAVERAEVVANDGG